MAMANRDEMAKSASDAQVLAEFREAFSHLASDCTICSWLTPQQQQAVDQYRKHFGKAPKKAWDMKLFDATDDELQMIYKFRDMLQAGSIPATDKDKEYVDDLMLLRYIRAREHHLDKSFKMICDSLQWRVVNKPWEMENVSTRTNKHASDARIVGYDLQGRVVVYSSFAKTNERTPDRVAVNVTCMMEKANLVLNEHSPGNVVWVNHFGARHKNGFNMWDCNPKFCFSGISLWADHYPEQLKCMIIVDPPAIFFGLWKVVKPLLPEKTQQKGEFMDSRNVDQNRKYLTETMGQELAEYLLQLMAEDAK